MMSHVKPIKVTRLFQRIKYNTLGHNFDPMIVRKHLDPELSRMTIYKHVSAKNKKCLSVGNFGILAVVVVVCSASTASLTLIYVWK